MLVYQKTMFDACMCVVFKQAPDYFLSFFLVYCELRRFGAFLLSMHMLGIHCVLNSFYSFTNDYFETVFLPNFKFDKNI